MGIDFVQVAQAGAATLLGVVATDAWNWTCAQLKRLRGRDNPEREQIVSEELATLEAEVVAARSAGEADRLRDIESEWRGRLRGWFREDPALADEFSRLLAEVPSRAPSRDETQVWQQAFADRGGSITQVGGNQYGVPRG